MKEQAQKGSKKESSHQFLEDSFSESIVETLRESLIILDKDLVIKRVNTAFEETFHEKGRMIYGKPLFELGNGQWDTPELRKLLEEIIVNNHEVKNYEVRHDFPKIGSRVMRLNARRLNADSHEDYIFLVLEDITERKRAEEKLQAFNEKLEAEVKARTSQLEKANKELESFSYSVSHDLRSPLRAITGYAKMLLEDHSADLDEEAQRFLHVIDDNAAKMGQLIDDLLAFSRMGRKEKELMPVDMQSIVKEVTRELEKEFGEDKWTINIQALPTIHGDQTMIKQALKNLLANSFKFSATREHPRIEVWGEIQGDFASFHIRDNGVGFDPAYQSKLFEVFQRLHGDHEFKGTGIGLSIVKRIIDRHGGEAWGEGKLNEGAEFGFKLPLSEN